VTKAATDQHQNPAHSQQHEYCGNFSPKLNTNQGIDNVFTVFPLDYQGETESTVNALPEQLEELWYRGVPLSEGPTLETMHERKVALLDFWDSRTDTVWGDRVRVAVEAFLRAEVQGTEHAYTREEVEDFNARRQCTRALDLEGPWEEVTAGVDPPW